MSSSTRGFVSDISDFVPLTGGCLCGLVRFEYSVAPLWRSTCHCSICQRISGSHWGPTIVGFPDGSIRITQGVENLSAFEATPRFRRFHCRTCFCPVYSQSLLPEMPFQDSAITSFDRDDRGSIKRLEELEPDSHIFYENVHGNMRKLLDTESTIKFAQYPD